MKNEYGPEMTALEEIKVLALQLKIPDAEVAEAIVKHGEKPVLDQLRYEHAQKRTRR